MEWDLLVPVGPSAHVRAFLAWPYMRHRERKRVAPDEPGSIDIPNDAPAQDAPATDLSSAEAAARRTCLRLEITVDDNTMSYRLLTPFRPNPWRRRVGGPLAGARADVETGGRITLRDTLTRFLRWPLDGSGVLFLPKKYDERELRIVVKGDAFAFIVPVHPKKGQLAYEVAAAINSLAQPRPDVTRSAH